MPETKWLRIGGGKKREAILVVADHVSEWVPIKKIHRIKQRYYEPINEYDILYYESFEDDPRWVKVWQFFDLEGDLHEIVEFVNPSEAAKDFTDNGCKLPGMLEPHRGLAIDPTPAPTPVAEPETPPPGYLGIVLDEGRRVATRHGATGVANFDGRNLPWELIKLLIGREGDVCPKEELLRTWRRCGLDEEPDDKRLHTAIHELRQIVHSINLQIQSKRKLGYTLKSIEVESRPSQ